MNSNPNKKLIKTTTTQFDILLQKAKTYDNRSTRFTDEQLDAKMNFDDISMKVQTLLKKKGYETRKEDCIIAIFQLIQKGGAFKNIDPSYNVLVGCPSNIDIEKPVYLTITILQEAFKKCGLEGKIRQFARKYASEIAKISKALNRPGMLTPALRRLPQNKAYKFPTQYVAWMSDFQSTNPECPFEVKILLNQLREYKRKTQFVNNTK